MVWDTIHSRDERPGPVEEWGGICYALEALSQVLPPGWEAVPVVKVGGDLSEEAFAFLSDLPRIRPGDGVLVVPEPNNRVEIRYLDRARRAERLSGGVPPWRWSEVAPLLEGLDALYVNFISGFEMELDTAEGLRDAFRGPIYADLHSLFLGIGRHGDRIPRPLPRWREWLRCFDAVQMNEDECRLLAGSLDRSGTGPGSAEAAVSLPGLDDPFSLGELAAEVLGPDLGLIAVTLGERGSAYVAAPGFEADPFTWPARRRKMAATGTIRSGKVAPEGGAREGDPTGSGDVWGATLFSRLLAGDSLEKAMGEANRMGSRNVEHRGARGLRLHLAGRMDSGDRRP